MKAVFFDAVGTVLFPAAPIVQVYADAAARHGLTIDPDSIGPKLWAQFRIEESRDREQNWVTSEAREEKRWRQVVFAAIDCATDDLFHDLYQHFAKPSAWKVPDSAAECIARLQARRVVVGMGSNYDSRLASVVNGISALQPLAECLVISSLVGTRKPGRFFFEEVVRTAGCQPSEIVFVGDDVENDYHGATTAGMRALLLDEEDKHTTIPNRIRSLSQVD